MYLTAIEAESRLQTRYNLDADLYDGHVEAGSKALDELAPFKDHVDFDNLPDALLDYVALYAFMLAEGKPGPIVRDAMSPFNTTYAGAEPNKYARIARELAAPYLKRTGVRT